MASKKSTSNAVVPAAAKSVAVVGGWRERAAKSIATGKVESAKLPQQSGNFLSFRGGTPSLGGVNLPNPLPVVILAYNAERSYYSSAYQPNVLAAPDCYSYGTGAPHEKSKIPQADSCASCRFNEFGSAQNGKGKACKEGVKFAMIHADALDSREKIATATIIQGRLSVLNSKGFRNYVSTLEDSDQPVWSSVTALAVAPDSKSQYAVGYQNVVVDLDDADLDAIAKRVGDAERLLSQPYPDIEEKQAAPAKGAPARKRKF